MVKCNIDVNNERLINLVKYYKYKDGVAGVTQSIINKLTEKETEKHWERVTPIKIDKPKRNIFTKRGSKKKNFLFVIAILFFIALPNISALIIEPNPLNANLNVSQPKEFEISLHNNFNYSIFNISFQNLDQVEFPIVTQMNTNETIQRTITITTTEQEFSTLTSKVTFSYFGNFTSTPTTTTSNLVFQNNVLRFDPNQLTLKIGDTLRIHNSDTISHSIYYKGNTINIPVDGNYDILITSIETFQVIEQTYSTILNINAISNQQQQLIHNEDYDLNFIINLNSLYQDTILEFEVLDVNFTVENNQQTEGLLRIKNIGDDIAVNIQLTSDRNFISFSQNNFNLNKNQNKYVTYSINPSFTSRNQTNKHYITTMFAKATNSNKYSGETNIFIPLDTSLSEYSGITDINLLRELLENALAELANYNNSDTVNVSSLLYRLNLTEEDVQNDVFNSLRQSGELKDIFQQFSELNKKNSGEIEIIKSDILSMLNLLNESNTRSKDAKNESESYGLALLIFFICTGIVVVFGYNYQYNKKLVKNRNIIGMFKGYKTKEYDYS